MKRIIGIGNALMDVLVPVDNYQLIDSLNLAHGGMVMIDEGTFKGISQKTSGTKKNYATGGSASNTIYGLAKLGVPTSFIGKVGDDEVGKIYSDDLIAAGVTPKLIKSTTSPTGCCTAFVTPDSERTMATYLGAAAELKPEDIREELFVGHDILHIEGYLLFNYELVEKAMRAAKKLGMTISLDLAAHNFVKDNQPVILKLLKDYVDICFANEDEAMAISGMKPEEALEMLSENCEYTIVKLGSRGSLVKHKGDKHEIDIFKADNVIDTTGAGDLFASGFIYGFSQGFSPDRCAKIGSLLGANIIQVYGARIDDTVWDKIHDTIKTI